MTVVMLLTSQAMATARGQSPVTDVMELCSGPVKTVYVDEDGTPVPTPRFCPDIAVSLLAFVNAVAPVATMVETSSSDLVWVLSDGVAPVRGPANALARGPPGGA